MSKATLYSDGGARGNPGPAGIGFVLSIEKKEPIKIGRYLGETTNNQAEYQALHAGITRAVAEGVTELACFLDSELVVKQLKGQYRMKNAELRPWFEKIQALKQKFSKTSFTHVLRAKNKLADQLVNEAIDKKHK